MCLRLRRRVWWGGLGGPALLLTWQKFGAMTTPHSTSIAMPPPYTVPEGTLIVNCLIMLTHNHEAEDGSHSLIVPPRNWGLPNPWVERAVPFRRGTAFLFNALDIHRVSGIPKASPTGVTHPRLRAFFAIELTQGPNLRFPKLHISHAIWRPQLGAPRAQGPKTTPCEGLVRCRGRVVAKCCGCEGLHLCVAHKGGLCVACQEGEAREGGEEEQLLKDPNGVNIEQCAQCFLPVGTTTGYFLLSGWGAGSEVVAPLTTGEVGGGSQSTPISARWPRCAMYTPAQEERHRAFITKFSKA